jgi:hypothetical protein
MAVTDYAGFRQGRRRDHKFSAGYPSFKKKGGVSERGISSRCRREQIAISKNLVRLRAMGIRSPARAHHKGVPRSVAGRSTPPAHGTRSATARPSPPPRRDQPPTPADAVTAHDYAAEPADHDGPLCRRCYGQALTPTSILCPSRHRRHREGVSRRRPRPAPSCFVIGYDS